jgi:hypothetical protein
MLANNTNTDDKPFIFLHGNLFDKNHCIILAEQITQFIDHILKTDKDIKIDDIAIISKYSNKNQTFEFLKDQLGKKYKELFNTIDGIVHLHTDDNGIRKSIDWQNTLGKTKILSIHGDKGKGHKVIIVINFSHNVIPVNINMHKYEELNDHSLMNVAFTRSLKYLFIGFDANNTSKYFYDKRNNIDKYAYCSWNIDGITHMLYKEIAIKNVNLLIKHNQNSLLVVPEYNKIEKKYLEEPIMFPLKTHLSITEIAKNACDYEIKIDVDEVILFGKNININFESDECKIIYGIMAELILYRNINFNSFYKQFEIYNCRDRIYYTQDDHLIGAYKNIINGYKIGDLIIKNEMKIILNDIQQQNMIVLHKIYDNNDMNYGIKKILDFTLKSEDIETIVWWNFSLLYSYMMDSMIKPTIIKFLNYFNDDIKILHNNVKFIENNIISTNISHGQVLHIDATLDDKKYKKMVNCDETNKRYLQFKKYKEYGIVGIYDFYDMDKSNIIELKASQSDICCNEWIIQSFFYSILLQKKNIICNKFTIINICRGKIYNFEIKNINYKEYLADILKKNFKYPEIYDIFIDKLMHHEDIYQEIEETQEEEEIVKLVVKPTVTPIVKQVATTIVKQAKTPIKRKILPKNPTEKVITANN